MAVFCSRRTPIRAKLFQTILIVQMIFDTSFFVDLVNATYGLESKNKLSVKKLSEADEKTGRMVKKAEAYFRVLPDDIPMFSHYDPAHYLLTHPELLDEQNKAVENTLNRFQVAIERINSYA